MGVDEAGRGPIAGPVVAAAVHFSEGVIIDGVDDSKKLNEAKRKELFEQITAQCHFGIGIVESERIDQINILNATFEAAKIALKQLSVKPDYLLTDYLKIDWKNAQVDPIVKGDTKSASIAAASIIAKVTRDRIMKAMDAEFPDYGFAGHKGYGTKSHFEVINEIGPCSIHRFSFKGVSFFDHQCLYSKSFEKFKCKIEARKFSKKKIEGLLTSELSHLPKLEKDLLLKS